MVSGRAEDDRLAAGPRQLRAAGTRPDTAHRVALRAAAGAAAIVFHPFDRAAAPQGAVITAGNYVVECRPGRHRVEIRGTRPMDESRVPPTMPRMPGVLVREDYLPAAFKTASTLEVEVTAGGPNVFNFNLTSPRP